MELEDKRSSHPDFMTSSELKASSFSGIRFNTLTEEREIWIMGNLEGRMSEQEAQREPLKWHSLYESIFAM
jgi:hypothetical protein